MGHQIVHTKYHRLANSKIVLDKGGVALEDNLLPKWVNTDDASKMIGTLAHVPRYVIYEDLIDMLNDRDGAMQKSLTAMIEHGLVHLPFKQVVVEFDDDATIGEIGRAIKQKVRHFVWLSEGDDGVPERFTAVPWTLVELPDGRNITAISPINAACRLVTEAEAEAHRKENKDVEIDGFGAGALFRAVPALYMRVDNIPRSSLQTMLNTGIRQHMGAACRAICALVVLTGTKGVLQEHVEINPRFNKSRVQSGKVAIQDHTVIRIGHTYSRDGTKVEYKGTGRSMPVHWRAGHVRNQRFGPKLSKSYDLWIEPMLINYSDGEEIPTPKIKEVTV